MFVDLKDFEMKTLGRKRDLIVYLPDDYDESDERYPVLYIQDGQNAFFDESAYSGVSWGFVEALNQLNLKLIMVAIPCGEGEKGRMDEYGPWKISEYLSYHEIHQEGVILGGEGIPYVDWMINELKPYLDTHFRTVSDDTTIIGSSMGAVISAYAVLARPDVFHKAAALSTAYWFYMDEFKELITHTDFSQIDKFYFDLGEFEGCGDAEVDQWYLDTNAQMEAWLEDKGFNLRVCYFEGATHNEAQWRKRLPDILKYLYME